MTIQPSWRPDPSQIADCNMARFFGACASRFSGAPHLSAPYEAWHAWSCERPEQFWVAMWDEAGVVADRDRTGASWSAVLEHGDRMQPVSEADGPRWFTGARLNFAENLLRHRGPEDAIVWRGEGAVRRALSRDGLSADVARCAAALRARGIKPGDRVAGFTPNVPEAVIMMLAAASCGALWSSCSPDFGAKGVLDRFGQIEPRVLLVADGYRYAGKLIDCLPRVEEIVRAIPSIECVVVVPLAGVRSAVEAPPPAELDPEAEVSDHRSRVLWSEFLGSDVAPAHQFERLPFDHPLYIMYSSGTTGLPKCMVHGAGGTLLQHAKEHRLHVDLRAGDRIFYFSTCGWMMWNWLVSALAVGATVVLYDGAPMPPGDAGALWRMAHEEQLDVFGTSARFIAMSEKEGVRPRELGPLNHLRCILSTGSPLAAEGYDFIAREVGSHVQVESISGGTDIISCFALGNPLLPVWRGELQCAGLGMAVDVYDSRGKPVRGEAGELVCTRPFPSMPVSFWNDPNGAKYRAAWFAHFPGVWRHGDWAERTEHGGFVIHGRSDATLNPGGVRIGTAEIYRQVELVAEVLESVVVAQSLSTSGHEERVLLFVRLKEGCLLDRDLAGRIRGAIRDGASPHHVPKIVLQVSDIPRTISGKISELAVREAVHGRPVVNMDALANPEAVALFRNRPELRL